MSRRCNAGVVISLSPTVSRTLAAHDLKFWCRLSMEDLVANEYYFAGVCVCACVPSLSLPVHCAVVDGGAVCVSRNGAPASPREPNFASLARAILL